MFKKGNTINLGRRWKHKEETKIKIGLANAVSIKKLWQNPDYKEHMSKVHQGYKQSAETIEKRVSQFRGKNNWMYIIDRTKLKKKEQRNDSAYIDWRKQVWSRDDWKCKIANQDCYGRIEAHHILTWREYPELRYEINNGITLCKFHHPRKRVLEQKMAPIFQELLRKD